MHGLNIIKRLMDKTSIASEQHKICSLCILAFMTWNRIRDLQISMLKIYGLKQVIDLVVNFECRLSNIGSGTFLYLVNAVVN